MIKKTMRSFRLSENTMKRINEIAQKNNISQAEAIEAMSMWALLKKEEMKLFDNDINYYIELFFH